ncbi:DUF2493 domain-containing protein [Methylomonas sp. EbA]|uniref:DUF2493 domain-containing protein n=2 Tax=Methylomonas albis TaxID=1854563 RepID=A0ABR9CZ38_9GAMM|nr:DUF2493 domain-containing protein [Methylomonas albis]
MIRVLVTGSTVWNDEDAIKRELRKLGRELVIVTGDTPGVDAVAISIASDDGLKFEAMKKNQEDYERYPKEAWKGLNERMLASGIDLVLAFHAEYNVQGKARGTIHAVELAMQSGVEVKVFTC